MKYKIILNIKISIICLLLWLTTSLNLKAQTSFVISYDNFCIYNNITKEFGDWKGSKQNILFVLNKEETILVKTVNKEETYFYVTSKEYDKEKDVYHYYVKTRLGSTLLFTFDLKNDQISSYFKLSNKESIISVYTISSVF